MRGCRLGHGAPETSGRRTRRLGWRCGRLGPMVLASFVAAAPPPPNPVYIDDSPRAWEQFQLAQDQVPDNAGEAVRLYQELLDEYAMKLVPMTATTEDQFVAVRGRVLAELFADKRLLERYRLIETAQAQRLLAAGELKRLAITRSATEPGLEALLRLGQWNFESARFRSALGWLSEAADHPDLTGDRASHCWYMIGMAAHYLGDAAGWDRAVAVLHEFASEAEPLRDAMRRLSAGISKSPVEPSISILDRAEAVQLHELVSQPIWSTRLDGTPFSQRALLAGVDRSASTAPRQPGPGPGVELTAAATVAGSVVYINEGRTIRAIDRFTGRSLWRPYVDRSANSTLSRSGDRIADLNIVVTEGNTLVTLTGHAYADGRDARAADRRVVCLDAGNGELRWARHIDRLDGKEEYGGLIPHGAPVVAEGAVFVLARKVSRQLLTSCYLISLDLADGRLRWARHIASSGGIRSRVARPFSSPIYHDGDLVVATPVGAVARIRADTGETRWLRRYPPPLNPIVAERRAWQIGGPVATPRGVIALRPDERRVILLDWESGDELASVSATGRDAWNAPRYFLANEHSVYGIGREIRVFRLEALDRPIWRLPGPARQSDSTAGTAIEDLEIYGRVQLTDGAIIVPTPQHLLVIDDETGQIRQVVNADVAGNPLATGAQLVVTGNERLDSYMPFRRAQQMLRQRLAGAPNDPGPALSLLQLGMRARDLGLALEAAELAIEATNADGATPASQSARHELFDMLLELDRLRIARKPQEGETLHAMIEAVAAGPDQRVEHLLAYGEWLADHALARAVEVYQSILSTADLAATPRFDGSVERPAAAWAAERLSRIIQRHGRTAYQPQSEFARLRLEQLRTEQDSAPPFLALAAEFPLADAAADAALHAANLYAAGGDTPSAVAALIAAYRSDPRRQRAERLLGAVVEYCRLMGWTATAQIVLRYVVETFGNIALEIADGSREAAAWLASLEPVDRPGRKPRVGEIQGVAERPDPDGRLVMRYPGVELAAPTDRMLLYDGEHLRMIASAGLGTLWSVQLGQRVDPHILQFDREQLLLWVVAPDGDAQAVMFDLSKRGARLWATPWMKEVLGEPPVPSRRDGRPGQRSPEQAPLDPGECLPLIRGNLLVVVRRSGDSVAFDLADRGRQRWKAEPRLALDRVALVLLHDFALVLGGSRLAAGEDDPVARLLLVDLATGRQLREITPVDGASVRWMAAGPLGGLLYGTGAGIEMLQLPSGRSLWSNLSVAAQGTRRGWLMRGSVIIQTQTDRRQGPSNPLRAIKLTNGILSDPFALPARRGWDPSLLNRIVLDDQRVFAMFGERIVRFDASGEVLGADSISDERDYKWLLPADDRLVLISRSESRQRRRRPTQHTYRVYSLSENCKLMGDAVELPPVSAPFDRAAVIDGWILLSSPSGTVAIAAPN